MHGAEFDAPLQNWFEFKIPKTTISSTRISNYLNAIDYTENTSNKNIIWTGFKEIKTNIENKKNKSTLVLNIRNKTGSTTVSFPQKQGEWMVKMLVSSHFSNAKKVTYKDFETSFTEAELGHFLLFWNEKPVQSLRKLGLLVL